MHRSSGRGALLASATISILASAQAQERQAHFRQTHQHTSWSLDAYIIGNTVTGPEEAYQYSMGQPIKHPAGYDVTEPRGSKLPLLADAAEKSNRTKHLRGTTLQEDATKSAGGLS